MPAEPSPGDARAALARDEGARVPDGRDTEFTAIALPLLPSVARVARALTHDESDADDLVQETYLRAYRHWHTFDAGSDCRRWLAAICRNTYYEQQHRARRVSTADDEELESLAAARHHFGARAAGLEDMYSRLDLGPAIARAIEALDPVFRHVAVLSDVDGFTYQEIAEMLQVPIGTVRSRLYRARRQLQETLMHYAIDAGFGMGAPTRPSTGEA
jgi:RNA polymerase sigma-70 factor (ECF subfamily)